MSQVSNLVKNKLSGIIAETENYHLQKRPGDREIIRSIAGGFISAIENLKKEGKRNGI